MLSEKQLIKDCKNGVKSSQYELVRRYSGMLMTVCRRYAKDDETAKDILQESLIRIFTYIHKYEHKGVFSAWMRKITLRCAIRYIQKPHFRKEVNVININDANGLGPDAYSNLGVEELINIIKELPDGYRTVFNLFVIDGMSHAEISGLLEITESASRSQLSRAKKLLQKKIELRNSKKSNSL